MIMETSLPSYDDELPRCDLLETYSLELAYQETVRKSDLIIRDEIARRLRLRVLLLEDENEELHGQLAFEDERLAELEQNCADLQARVEQAEATSYRYELDLRIKTRELNNLKAELNSMNGLSTDSARHLSEKLSLSRELATVKTELDHLRSQANYQQTVLAEKLALQRQVNTLEVELETEKHGSKRRGCNERESDKENGLQKEVEELRNELSRERREKGKVQKAGDKGSKEWEQRKTVLETKVEQLRTKLRESKEQVKELQTQLAQAQAVPMKASVSTEDDGAPIKLGRKRNAGQMSTDATIGTPGKGAVRGKRPAVKCGKPDQTSLGEKSMFSVTPYLNRTLSVAPETPRYEAEPATIDNSKVVMSKQEVVANSIQPIMDTAIEGSPSVPESAVIHSTSKQRPKAKAILGDAKNSIVNTQGPQKKVRTVGTLQKVKEEGVDENVEPISIADNLIGVEPSVKINIMTAVGTEPKKKRRKLLGTARTIFDEDDGEATKRPAKVNLGPRRGLAKTQVIGNMTGSAGGLIRSAPVFGAFSPLKKDRKGAQASFLG